MPFPVPVKRQREVVYLAAKGHNVILGTAGSGKTTMAILRAAYLSDPELPGNGPVLLLTYNKALGSYIRAISDGRLKNVTVETYHRFARGYLASHNLMERNDILSAGARRRLVESALAEVKALKPATAFLSRTTNFFDTEVGWIAKNGIVSLATYLNANRVGRGEPLLEGSRRLIWDIRERYLAKRVATNRRYDWDDVALTVSEQFAVDGNPRRYKHIVIDEGQDLSPQMLRSIASAVPPDGTITFFGDVAQQIYGQRVSWRSAGLNPPKVWEFSENYRNSREIAALGLAVAQMDYYRGVADMVAPNAPTAAGPKPTLVELTGTTLEAQFVADQAKAVARNRSVAILVRTVNQHTAMQRFLPNTIINLREDKTVWVDGPQLYLGTYHAAKGLEFDTVILPFMSDDQFPDPAQVSDFGPVEADANDGRLLYVGITRAKSGLIITYKGRLSHLLPALPADLYTRVKR
ncbi:AAA family ATPase [Shinella sp. PSBB067]|uniref:3'-5' exonuclease n=1 Tax=Shinella sp. PSBB067 TaxID=2715959 RepID=UPI00193C1186|nr:3'-5' exonuclease [Shinella sp. PSBB067]QRI63776.1 AAA family ATPase [Shinella sp. PSBB067]